MSIDIRHVSKHFGSVCALSDINLSIGDGELLALLGPSGSGKSTLLRIIAGLDYADPVPGDKTARILFNGQPVDQRDLRQRGVGFVFQHYSLFKHLTVFENIAFGLRVRPRRSRPDRAAIRAKVIELLKLIQLEPLARRYPHQLSGGQRQRVALARALAVEPAVLLLDEPFGALDAKVRSELRNWLRHLHDKINITSVFVTHDQEEALEVADRVVIMNQGVIEQIGSPYEVFHEPKTAFVMDFIGASNRFQNWLTKPDRPSAGRTGAAKPVAGKPGGVAKPGGGKPEGVSASDAPSASEYYVRPHEIVIHHHPLWKLLPWKALVRATVQSVREAGATVKVELEDQYGRPVNAELTHKAFNAARVKVGQTVYLEFKKFRRFVGRSGV